MKIANYCILSSTSAADLSSSVRLIMKSHAEAWEPFGPPFACGSAIFQAMVVWEKKS